MEKGYLGKISPILLFLGLTIFEIGYFNYDFHRSDAMQYISVAVYIIHILSAGLMLLIASGITSLINNKERGWVIACWVFLAQTVISALSLSLLSFLIYLVIGGYTEVAFRKSHGGVKLFDVAMHKEPKEQE